MKQITNSFMGLFVLLLLSMQAITQKKQMTWTTKSKAAGELAQSGSDHMMNNEFEQAYSDLSAALKLDPNFTVALVMMSTINTGASRKNYGERALKSVSGKTEGEKLFATLADETISPETTISTWARLHTMFPDGKMIGYYYVQSRPTPDERFQAAQEYIKQFPDEAAMYNSIAYMYMNNKKDNAMAKKNLDKYLAMYPEGSNPYDSMGEYYLNTGDMENSKKYYTMALEKYPYLNSSVAALQKMADEKKKSETTNK